MSASVSASPGAARRSGCARAGVVSNQGRNEGIKERGGGKRTQPTASRVHLRVHTFTRRYIVAMFHEYGSLIALPLYSVLTVMLLFIVVDSRSRSRPRPYSP